MAETLLSNTNFIHPITFTPILKLTTPGVPITFIISTLRKGAAKRNLYQDTNLSKAEGELAESQEHLGAELDCVEALDLLP